ncbi:MAG TPA: winged helix-turn-helix domain-containing protein [Solirubrobacterales bacterium]|jgi:DNA-binding transcriptional ArsR family regulator|nr:winged helix-turn-helix domain-containing protein [Solirubrobacterales bacterium]
MAADRKKRSDTRMAAKRKAQAKKKADGETTKKPARSKHSAAKRRETVSRRIATKIAKGLAHPLRVQLLTILNDRTASPNELHKELGEGLSQVSYHIKVLRDFKMIEMVKTQPRRGAVEHFYRATSKVYVPSWVAALWPRSIRVTTSGAILEEIEVDLMESIEAGLLADRPDEVMSRDSRIVDGQAREAIEQAAAEFFERFERAGRESAKRLRNSEGGGETIQTSAAVMVFTSLKGRKLKVNGQR